MAYSVHWTAGGPNAAYVAVPNDVPFTNTTTPPSPIVKIPKDSKRMSTGAIVGLVVGLVSPFPCFLLFHFLFSF